ncbi:hypothetical protein BDV96DRAFT_666705 [Lophiotrema nucula]|uniref:Uncharacterized protein n=1 Tax=Lophiotrema nucula TaxID=690887 RepID=A0A6A5YUW8_9PLEO|nr:hypothetical protein BDV96DRAFT_666705 [Lophiotrema nucula]
MTDNTTRLSKEYTEQELLALENSYHFDKLADLLVPAPARLQEDYKKLAAEQRNILDQLTKLHDTEFFSKNYKKDLAKMKRCIETMKKDMAALEKDQDTLVDAAFLAFKISLHKLLMEKMIRARREEMRLKEQHKKLKVKRGTLIALALQLQEQDGEGSG